MIDKIDVKLLNIIQQDSRSSNAALADKVGLTKTAVFERAAKWKRRASFEATEPSPTPKRCKKVSSPLFSSEAKSHSQARRRAKR